MIGKTKMRYGESTHCDEQKIKGFCMMQDKLTIGKLKVKEIFLSLFLFASAGCGAGQDNLEKASEIIELGDGRFKEVGLPASELCVSTHIDIRDEEKMIRELDMLKRAGVSFIRRDFFWSEIEPEKDKFSEEAKLWYRTLVERAEQRGIGVIPILAYGTKWSSEESQKCYRECEEKIRETTQEVEKTCLPQCDKFSPDPKEYADFVKWVAENFPEIKKFEIWNEPNYIFFLRPNSPESYTPRLISASQGIREIRGEKADIILGGILMSDVPSIPDNIVFVWYRFLGGVGELGGFNFVDSVAFHPYIGPKNFPYPPSLPPEDEKNSAGSLIQLTLGIKKVVPFDKNLYITEIGWASSREKFLPEEKQASYIVRSILLSSMLGVKIICIYTFADIPGETYLPHEAEKYFGIVKADFSPKPAYNAIAGLMKFLKGKKYIGEASVYLNIEGNEIKVKNGKIENSEGDIDINLFSPVFEGEREVLIFLWATTKYGEDMNSPVNMMMKINRSKDKIRIYNMYGEVMDTGDAISDGTRENTSEVKLSVDSDPKIVVIETGN